MCQYLSFSLKGKVLISYFTFAVASFPIISGDGTNILLRPGESYEETCTGSTQMVWNHQRPLSKRSKTVSRSPVQGKNNQLVLTLNNVEMKHVGLYTCADKETGNIYSSFYLFIKGKLLIISIYVGTVTTR